MDRKKIKKGNGAAKTLMAFYTSLYGSFGAQGWWPGRTRFEVIVGAILTQNTAWTNVEKAITNLRASKALTPEGIHSLDVERLAALIKPAGYFNIKAKRLKNFTDRLFGAYGGSIERLFKKDSKALREELLSVNGIGPETADSIILYAAGRPEFVVDAYTKRILKRHGLAKEDTGYEEMKSLFMENLRPDERLFNEYHALIVRTGKELCKAKDPSCGICPLKRYLQDGSNRF